MSLEKGTFILKQYKKLFNYLKGNSNKKPSFMKERELKGHNQNKNGIKSFKIANNFYFDIIFLIIFMSIFSHTYSDNYIILTIEGSGLKSIINSEYTPLPTKIKINENSEITGNIERTQNLDEDVNIIKLEFSLFCQTPAPWCPAC